MGKLKKKFLALAMASAVMVMGAGYAYWTDASTLNGTVSTGEFNVNVVSSSAGGRTDAYTGINGTEWGKYVRSDSVFTDKTVTANLINLFPGSSANMSFVVKNAGTIPAMFDSAKVDITGDTELKSKMVYWLKYTIKNQDTKIPDITNSVYRTDLNNYETELNALLKGVRLEPDQTLVIGDEGDQLGNLFTFRLPTTVVNTDNVEKQKIGVNITLNWRQHNAQ